MQNGGFSGKVAKAFITSKLTILLMIAFLLIGAYSTFLIPREEEPQIQVPIADIFIGFPGASPSEMESKVIAPLERVVSNIKGVEYVYSTSLKGQGMLIVQFYVGEDVERSLVKLYNEIMKNMDKMPQGVTFPLIKSRAIDDVPVLGLTLWSDKTDDYTLRQVSEVLTKEIKKIPNIADVKILGGRSRVVNVILDKDKMAENKLDFLSISKQIQGSNAQMMSGSLLNNNTSFAVETGNFLRNSEEMGNLVVGVNQQQPVYLRQIAKVEEGPATSNQYVSFGFGAAEKHNLKSNYPAITLAIAKKKGTDAMHLSKQILEKVEHIKNDIVSNDIHVETTRNYGETASEKVSELLFSVKPKCTYLA